MNGLYRTQHQQIMAAGSRNFQGPLDVLLAHDVGKVHCEAARAMGKDPLFQDNHFASDDI